MAAATVGLTSEAAQHLDVRMPPRFSDIYEDAALIGMAIVSYLVLFLFFYICSKLGELLVRILSPLVNIVWGRHTQSIF